MVLLGLITSEILSFIWKVEQTNRRTDGHGYIDSASYPAEEYIAHLLEEPHISLYILWEMRHTSRKLAI